MAQNTIKVWDIFIRVFHWSLVILFTIAYFTGEEDSNLHIYSGYAIIGLVITRIIWGFIGSKYAKFSDFIHSPSYVITYLKNVKSATPKHYLGHNPAGGYMIIALLTMLFVVSFSGLKVYGLEGGGPLAHNNTLSLVSTATADNDKYKTEEHEKKKVREKHEENEAEEEFWEEIHEISANIMLLLIFIHVLGVIISGHLHRENLVKAMITGRKKVDNH